MKLQKEDFGGISQEKENFLSLIFKHYHPIFTPCSLEAAHLYFLGETKVGSASYTVLEGKNNHLCNF